jgi:hypothetical protein
VLVGVEMRVEMSRSLSLPSPFPSPFPFPSQPPSDTSDWEPSLARRADVSAPGAVVEMEAQAVAPVQIVFAAARAVSDAFGRGLIARGLLVRECGTSAGMVEALVEVVMGFAGLELVG